MQFSLHSQIVFLIFCSSFVEAQQPQAKDLLAHALHLADLYNWVDAGPEFTKAEQMFLADGDQRNALYAKLGRIRSNLEREPRTLAESSAQLADELDSNPL